MAQIIRLKPFAVITKDLFSANISCVFKYDGEKIDDDMIQAVMRDIVGKMALEAVISDTNVINELAKSILEGKAKNIELYIPTITDVKKIEGAEKQLERN